jgi:hypothetical protein
VRSLVVLVALLLAAPAVAADGEPRKALTKKDQATAKSIVLRRSDLGAGFTAMKRPDDEPLPKGARCGALDEGDLTVTGDANSPDFRLATGGVFVTVGSSAHIYRTLGDANTSWRRGTSKQTLTCLGDIVRLSAAPGQKISIVSSKQVAFPAVAPKTSAYRLVVTIAATGTQRVRAYVDAIVLQRGKIQSVLLFTSLGRPIADAERTALAAVVAARMARKARPSGPVA